MFWERFSLTIQSVSLLKDYIFQSFYNWFFLKSRKYEFKKKYIENDFFF